MDAALPNFGVVDASVLYRGAQPQVDRSRSVDGFKTLVDTYRIKTIVDLTNDPIDHWILRDPYDCQELGPAQRLRLQYISLPSLEALPSESRLIALLRIVRDPANQPVFVHCSAGENRTGALVAGFRVVVDHWEPAAAKAEMTRFDVSPVWRPINDAFVDRVQAHRADIERAAALPADKEELLSRCEP